MNIIRARKAGFCMGVARAIEILDSAISELPPHSKLFTLGPIIHNPQVLEYYENLRVKAISPTQVIDAGATLIIRAHGIPKHIEQDLQEQGFKLLDATCPKVKKAQRLIAARAELGDHLLIFGEKEHPEVKALRSYAGKDPLIFDSLEQLPSLAENVPCCLAAQTTQDREAFVKIVDWLGNAFPGLPLTVLDTICDATRIRQEEVRRLSKSVEAMVVVGGRESGNTRRLAEIAGEHGLPVFHVETETELPLDELSAFSAIGLSAGASTPGETINLIERALNAVERRRAVPRNEPPVG